MMLAGAASSQRSRREAAHARSEAMNDRPVWEAISTAPFGRDLELAVIEGDRVHPLVFACHRAPDGWIKAQTHERVVVSPTHWRLWSPKG
jgi:hypothetical protein